MSAGGRGGEGVSFHYNLQKFAGVALSEMAMALEPEGTLVSMVRASLSRASREMTEETARRYGCSSTKGKKEQHLLSMMTPPLSSMVMAEQIHHKMWERNGSGVMRGKSSSIPC